MIKIVLHKKGDNIIAFDISGHGVSQAELNSAIGDAYDLVCNTVSVLSQSIIIGMEEVLHIEPQYSIKDGYLSLSPLEGKSIELSQVLLKTFEKSLESTIKSLDISFGCKKRKEYINLIEKEV